MSPPTDSQDRLLEQWQAYLRLLARWTTLAAPLRAKVDLSGVVQQTWLEAYQKMAEVQQMGEAERAVWLQRAFAHNLNDEIGRFRTQGRDVEREQSLEAAVEDSSARLMAFLAADQSSPSQQAIAHEQQLRLAWGLEQLPEDQRWAMEMKLQGRSMDEIAEEMKRGKEAAAMLIYRATKKLHDLLAERDESS